MERNPWRLVTEELPPCDGYYEIGNVPYSEREMHEYGVNRFAYYDGHGFLHLGRYGHPKYWRVAAPEKRRYGKLKE